MTSSNYFQVHPLRWRSRVFDRSLSVAVLVVAPMFGAMVDFVYLILLVMMLNQVRMTESNLMIIAGLIFVGVILFAANSSTAAPYFSYFFIRIALLVLVFLSIPRISLGPPTAWLWIIFVVYVVSIIYQYLALPGSEILEGFHADQIADISLTYRASGLFSGYFSAATIIGSLGAILILRSNVAGIVIAAFMMLVVAFCSGRSVFIYLVIALAVSCWLKPRASIIAAGIAVVTILLLMGSSFEHLAIGPDIEESMILFTQIFSILSGSIEGTSTEALIHEHYYLPDDLKTMLIGNNLRPFTPGGVASDSGYIQLLFGAGVIGALLYILILAVICYRSRSKIVLTLFVAALVVSIKGNVFNAIGVLDTILLFCAGREAVAERRFLRVNAA